MVGAQYCSHSIAIGPRLLASGGSACLMSFVAIVAAFCRVLGCVCGGLY